MMTDSCLYLTNGLFVFKISDRQRCAQLWEELETFLDPSFHRITPDLFDSFDCHIIFRDYSEFPSNFRAVCTQRTVIRESGKDEFRLYVQSGYLGDGRMVSIDENKKTAYCITAKDKKAVIYASPESFVHVIEFMRYGALLVEEAQSTVLLHASAADTDDGIFLFLGNKGAGKTTSLLTFLCESRGHLFAGDKVLVREVADRNAYYPWPDYPHVGIGTLKSLPISLDSFGVDPLHPDGTAKANTFKELLDPELYARHFPKTRKQSSNRIAGLIFPNIQGRTGELIKIPDAAKTTADILDNIEYPHEFTPGHWHGIYAPISKSQRSVPDKIVDRMLSIPWFTMDGLPADLAKLTAA